jgi:PAS domain S-box-containing protein
MSKNLCADSGEKVVSETTKGNYASAEDLLTVFFEWSKEGIIVVLDGLIVFANRAFAGIVGKEITEIMGTPFLDYFAVEYRRMVGKKYEQRIRKKIQAPVCYEVEITDSSGVSKIFDLSASLVTLSGKPAVIIGLKSISERKLVEEHLKEAEKKFRTIFEKTPVGMVSFDENGLIVDTNEAFRAIFGYLPSKTNILDLISEDRARNSVKEIIEGRSLTCRGEFQLESGKDTKSIRMVCNSFLIDGNFHGRIGIFEDISLQKTARQTYYCNKARLELILELSQMEDVDFDYFVRIALAKAVEFTSNRSGFFYFFEELHGLKDSVYSYSPTGDVKEKEEILSSVSLLFSTDFRDPDNENSIYIPAYENEKIVFVAGFDKDLPYTDTEQRNLMILMQDIWSILQKRLAEQALQASEMKYSTLVENGNDGIVIIQEGILRFVNTRFCEFVGQSTGDLPGTEVSAFVSEEFRRMVSKKFSKIPDNPNLFQKKYEIELLSKDNRHIPVEVSSSVIYHEGKPAIMAIFRDITEQKAKENELLDALNALRVMQSVIRTSPAIVCFWAPKENWPVEFVSENIENFGYTAEEFLSGKLQFGDIVHPSDIKELHRKIGEYSKKGSPSYNLEYRIITKSGEIRWVEERTSIHYDSKGHISHYQGLILDITDKKRVNSFLDINTSMDNFFSPAGDVQEIFSQMLDLALHVEGIDCGALYIVDKGNLNLIAHNNLSESYVRQFNSFEKDSLAGRFLTVDYPVYKLFPELYPLAHGKDIPDQLFASAILPVVVRNRLAAVLLVASHENYDISPATREALEKITSQMETVMGRIGKEADLHKNQNDLQCLFDSIGELVFVIDTEGCIVYGNRKVYDALGFSREELKGINFIKLHSHNNVLEAAKAFESALQGYEVRDVFSLSGKKGDIIEVESSFRLGEWNEKKAVIAVSRQTGICIEKPISSADK